MWCHAVLAWCHTAASPAPGARHAGPAPGGGWDGSGAGRASAHLGGVGVPIQHKVHQTQRVAQRRVGARQLPRHLAAALEAKQAHAGCERGDGARGRWVRQGQSMHRPMAAEGGPEKAGTGSSSAMRLGCAPHGAMQAGRQAGGVGRLCLSGRPPEMARQQAYSSAE